MMDLFQGLQEITILNLGSGGLVVLVILGFLRGWIFTRAHYNDIVASRDRWEAAYWKEKETSALQDRQNAELLETARILKSFVEREGGNVDTVQAPQADRHQ
jgi:hypothetical protein